MNTKYLIEANIQLGKNLEAFRKKRGLSQEELGDVLGIHQSAISRVESGAQELSAYQVFLLNKNFGFRYRDLFEQL